MANGDFAGHSAFLEALLDLTTGWTFRLALLNGWTPDTDADIEWADISAFEVSLSGYTAGGATLTGVSVSLVSGEARLDADNVTWASLAAGTVSRAALLADDGVTNWVVGNIVLLEMPSGVDYTVVVDAAGLFGLAWA